MALPHKGFLAIRSKQTYKRNILTFDFIPDIALSILESSSVFDTPMFYATVFASKISWRKWPSSTLKIFGVTYMFSSMVPCKVKVR